MPGATPSVSATCSMGMSSRQRNTMTVRCSTESPPESALQLVAVVHLPEGVERSGRLHLGDIRDTGQIASLPGLAVAGTHKEPIRPGLVLGRIAKAADVAPDVHEGSLRRILGRLGVTEDAVGHAVQAGTIGERQGLEGTLVAVLYPDHQVLVHAPIHRAGGHHGRPRGRVGRGPSNGMGRAQGVGFPDPPRFAVWSPGESPGRSDAPYM